MEAKPLRANLDGRQRVALLILRQHFGEPAEVICDALMKRPRRSLKELQNDCQALPLGQLRNGLLVLIQHNLVSAVVDASGKSKECRYTFDTGEAVLRLRFPKFSACIRNVRDAVAESVMEAVLDHGRATWDQIKAACRDLPEDKVKEAANFLVNGRYLTRIVGAAPGEDLPDHYVEYASSSRGGGKRRAQSPPAQRPAKVRRMDDVPEDGIAAIGLLWRVNPEAFDWDLRGHAICNMAKDQAGVEAGSMMQALLAAVRPSALSHRLQSISVDDLLEQAKDDPESANVKLSWETVSERLMALSQDGLVKRVNETGISCYQPNIKKLRRSVRQDIIERVVEAKMGWQARRVMGLLLHYPLLESKSVWDLAMLPKKDANEVLCRMLKSGYVGLQEVPRTADHSAQRTFFLWYVDMDKILKLVEDDMLRSLQWLLQKREEKRQESEELIGVGGEVSDLAAAPAQMQQYNALQTSIERLEQAVLRIDETLLLLADDA